MGLKYLLSAASMKDILVQFGAFVQTYSGMVQVAIEAFVKCVWEPNLGKVHWDLSLENAARCVQRNKLFLDIPNVITMVDGDKLFLPITRWLSLTK